MLACPNISKTITQIIDYLPHALQQRLSFCAPWITLQQPMGHILNLPQLTFPTPFLLPRQLLPSFTLNLRCGPPLNIIMIRLRVLLATSKHCDSIHFSFSSHKAANLGLVLSSHVRSSSINLFAQISNFTLISTLDRPRTSLAPTPHHRNDLRHSCSFIIHVPPHSIASIAATLQILSSYNGVDSILNQNAAHLTLASQATGTVSASISTKRFAKS